MKKIPALGARVRYVGKWATMKGVVGTVERIFPAYTAVVEGERIHCKAAASVKVDSLPANWPYSGTDVFAPWISELEPLSYPLPARRAERFPLGIEFDKWLKVKTDSAESARAFFGMPPDWPAEFEGFETDPTREPGRVFRVLSDSWVRQQNAKKEKA